MQAGLKAALPEKPEVHFPPGSLLAQYADPAIPNAPFLRAPGDEAAERGDAVSLGQEIKPGPDRNTAEHQAGTPQPKILPWSLQAHNNNNNSFADYFHLFTVPGSVLGLGLWKQPPLALFCIACQTCPDFQIHCF